MIKYETLKDLSNQQRVMDAFAKQYGYQYTDLPEFHEMDYAIQKTMSYKMVKFARVEGLVEVKCRTISFKKYPTFMVHLKKVNYALNCGVPAILLVGWTDAIGFIKFKERHFVTLGGRRDRDNKYDYDLMAHYPTDKFEMVWTK